MTAASPDPDVPTRHRRAGARWFTLFTLAWLAIWTAQLTPLQLLIPLQLNTPGDAQRWISGVVSAGLVLAVGGLAGVIAGPLAGGMSDRTRSTFGRRRPWALGGVVLGVGYGAYMAVGLALGADLLPFPEDSARDLGFVTVAASLGQLLGPLIGAGLVAAVGGFWLLFLGGAVLSVIGGLMTLMVRAEPRHPSSPAPDPAPR